MTLRSPVRVQGAGLAPELGGEPGMTVEPRAFRDTLGRMPTGVTVITTTAQDGEMHGVTIGSFSSLSLEPRWCCSASTRTQLPPGVSRQHPLCGQRAGGAPVGPVLDFRDQEFAPALGDLDYSLGEASGAPLMAGAVAQIECATEAIHDGGDHDILIGRAKTLATDGAGRPLIFFAGGYRRLDADCSS